MIHQVQKGRSAPGTAPDFEVVLAQSVNHRIEIVEPLTITSLGLCLDQIDGNVEL